MRLLLDTHTFLWFIQGNNQLSNTAQQLIVDTNNDVLLSIASIWEMAIKISLGRMTVSQPFDTFIKHQITLLEISVDDTTAVISLPFHHLDPFDRLLIAQAMTQQMPIVGRDSAFDSYTIKRLW